MKFTRTRIAPTPSGYLHLGNASSFALTAKLAQQYGAKVLLRIDDLDRDRVNPTYVQDVFDALNFLQIPWHEGPRDMQEYEQTWSQQHRMPLYLELLERLKASGKVFACTCSRTQIIADSPTGVYTGTCLHKNIPLSSPDVSWRLNTSAKETLNVKNLSGELSETTLPDAMQYFVVRKKDEFPAYQLASLADDVHFNVDLIVRGADLWESTLAQLYLARVLGLTSFEEAVFHHHPLKLTGEGTKLSKSEGATSIQFLRKQGLSKEDVYAMLGDM